MKFGIMELHVTDDDKLYIGVADPQHLDRTYAELDRAKLVSLIAILDQMLAAIDDRINVKKRQTLDGLRDQVAALQAQIKEIEQL